MDFGLGAYGLGLIAGILSTLSPCVLPIIPILLGSAKPVHILTPTATVRRIVNMTALTVVEAGR